jgi:Zn-dependent protease
MDSFAELVINILIYAPIVLFSITIHEVSHGWAAYRMGDPTAKMMGRLTLNPLKHLDLFGSFILPLSILVLFRGKVPPIGWAKPVPVNFSLLRNQRLGFISVGLAGPLSNILLATFAGLAARVLPMTKGTELLLQVFVMNMFLALFNLVPIPPLDGSRILFGFLSRKNQIFLSRLEPYGMIIIIFLIASGSFSDIFYKAIFTVIRAAASFISGYNIGAF